jgi:hypothetical protein
VKEFIKNFVADYTWFLRSGIAPKNSSPSDIENLKNMNHMSSKKFAMTIIAISIVAFMYFSSIFILFLFPNDPHVSAVVSMYKDMIVSVASIAATLVGIQGLVDWKHNSSSSSNISSQTINEEIKTNTNNAKEEDYTTTI